MIQRIQSIYLLLAILLCVAAVYVQLPYAFTNGAPLDIAFTSAESSDLGNEMMVVINGGNYSPETWLSRFSSFPLYILVSIISLISFFCLFRFEKIKKQFKTCGRAITFSWLLLLVAIILVVADGITGDKPWMGLLFPVAILLFLTLAKKSIKKDKKTLDDLHSGRLR